MKIFTSQVLFSLAMASKILATFRAAPLTPSPPPLTSSHQPSHITPSHLHLHPSQCVAYVAAAEIPAGEWPDVISRLLGNVTGTGIQNTEAVKEASLEAIGYICEEMVSSI